MFKNIFLELSLQVKRYCDFTKEHFLNSALNEVILMVYFQLSVKNEGVMELEFCCHI